MAFGAFAFWVFGRRLFAHVFAAPTALLFIFFLGGCGDGGKPSSAILPSSRDVGFEKTPDGPLSPLSFHLLNQDDEEGPALTLDGTSPFGVLLHPVKAGEAFCSLSHIDTNRVLTAAHCVDPDDLTGDSVIYYDKTRQKRVSRVVKSVFVGDPKKVDMAVLLIDPKEAENWDVVESSSWAPTLAQSDSELLDITLSSFDPLRAHPALAQEFGYRGMVFRSKSCDGTRTTPNYFGINAYNGKVERLGLTDKNPAISIYYDHCSAIPIPGNSGGLLTLGDHLDQIVGVVTAMVHPSLYEAQFYGIYQYTTLRGVVQTFTLDEAFGRGLFWMGVSLADLDSQLRKQTAIASLFHH